MNEILGTIHLILAIWNFSYLFRTDTESNKYNRKQSSFFVGCLTLLISITLFFKWGIFKWI